MYSLQLRSETESTFPKELQSIPDKGILLINALRHRGDIFRPLEKSGGANF